MPELPEVQTIVSQLNAKVLKRTFVGLWTDAPSLIRGDTLAFFKKKIKNQKIFGVSRAGKQIVFDLGKDIRLILHLKMTGHLMYGKWRQTKEGWVSLIKGPLKEDKNNGYIHFVFHLDNGFMLALSDLRKFARLELVRKGSDKEKEKFALGPDPTSKDFTFPLFKENILKKGNWKIKQALMDQKTIAGIGNIYSDEILWESKIHPVKKVKDLSVLELKKIYSNSIKILKRGIAARGESFSDYRDLFGEKGGFDKIKKAYKREKLPCYRCKTPLSVMKIGQRSARFCPHCQKL